LVGRRPRVFKRARARSFPLFFFAVSLCLLDISVCDGFGRRCAGVVSNVFLGLEVGVMNLKLLLSLLLLLEQQQQQQQQQRL
jgi:hypothetical protein